MFNSKKRKEEEIIDERHCQGRLDKNRGHHDRKNFKNSYHYH